MNNWLDKLKILFILTKISQIKKKQIKS